MQVSVVCNLLFCQNANSLLPLMVMKKFGWKKIGQFERCDGIDKSFTEKQCYNVCRCKEPHCLCVQYFNVIYRLAHSATHPLPEPPPPQPNIPLDPQRSNRIPVCFTCDHFPLIFIKCRSRNASPLRWITEERKTGLIQLLCKTGMVGFNVWLDSWNLKSEIMCYLSLFANQNIGGPCCALKV